MVSVWPCLMALCLCLCKSDVLVSLVAVVVVLCCAPTYFSFFLFFTIVISRIVSTSYKCHTYVRVHTVTKPTSYSIQHATAAASFFWNILLNFVVVWLCPLHANYSSILVLSSPNALLNSMFSNLYFCCCCDNISCDISCTERDKREISIWKQPQRKKQTNKWNDLNMKVWSHAIGTTHKSFNFNLKI